jgi:hypothetical protein
MKIDKDLNVVIRIQDEDGKPIVIHHTPLQNLIFESNWELLREAHDGLVSGKAMGASVRLAKKILVKAGETLGKESEAKDLIDSISGATFVYTTKPELLDQSSLSSEMKEEVLARLIFFISYRLHTFPSEMKGFITLAKNGLSTELTSSTAMELFNSSTTSTTAEPIGNTEPSLPI